MAMKTIQEIIPLIAFGVFSVLCLKEHLKWKCHSGFGRWKPAFDGRASRGAP